jgi:hydroxyacylglutathione hydrolase
VAWLLDGQPEAPKYFAQMKKVNKLGPPLTERAAEPANFDRATLDAVIEDGGQVFDLRNRGQFAAGHVPGTINVPTDNNTYITYLGWLVDYDRPVYLVLPSVDSAERWPTCTASASTTCPATSARRCCTTARRRCPW